MTAPNLAAIERDVAAVLVRHGLAGHESLHIAAYEITQGGQPAGVTITAQAYTRPHVGQMEAAS